MKTGPSGIDLIKSFEALELVAYKDIADVWTIGYGHTKTAVPGMRITGAEAEELLQLDLIPGERAINSVVKQGLSQNQFDALSSLAFNIGPTALAGSTVVKRINSHGAGEYAAKAILWWNKATVGGVFKEVRGLTRRRQAEYSLFMENPKAANEAITAFYVPEATAGFMPHTYRQLRQARPVEIQPLYDRIISKLKRIS